MKGLHWLKLVLEASVKNRGEIPLTNAHLLNIVNLAIRAEDAREARIESKLNEILGEDAKWGK